MQKNFKRRQVLLSVSVLSGALLLFTGLACFASKGSLALGFTGAALMLLPLLAAGIQKVISRNDNQRQSKKTEEQLQKERLALRENDKAVEGLIKKLRATRMLTRLQGVFHVLCGIGADLFTPALIILFPSIAMRVIFVFVILTLWPSFLIYLGLLQIPSREDKYSNAVKSALNDKDYPLLTACACKIAKESGFHKVFCVILTNDRNIGILSLRGGAALLIDPVLLNIFTEEELTACLRHEFAHRTVPAAQRISHTEERYMRFLRENGGDDKLTMSALRFFYGELYIRYIITYESLNYATSIDCELAADRAMLPSGAKTAAALLTKLFCEENFEYEDRWADHPFPDEECLRHGGENDLNRFLMSAREKTAFRLSLISREIPSRSNTHPTLAARLAALGEEIPEVSFDVPDGAWKDECLRLLRQSDRDDYEYYTRSGAMEGIKKDAESIAAWEREGEPTDARVYPDILTSLLHTGQAERGKELCDRILSDENAAYPDKALFYRGQWRLGHFDDGGIDDLKRYISVNALDAYSAYDIIGSYCCRMGLQEELDTYRRDTIAKAQADRSAHMEQAGVIEKKNLSSLSPYHFSKKEQEDGLLRLLESVSQGQVEELYLVRQKLMEGREVCVVVVHYDVMIKPELQEEIDHQLYLYLDSVNDEWYYLRDYADYEPNLMKKLSDCRVYVKTM